MAQFIRGRFRRRLRNNRRLAVALTGSVAGFVIVLLVLSAGWETQRSDPVAPKGFMLASAIEAIDGDTVRSGGYVYRLVGFDTPETGDNARCENERLLGERSTKRLIQLVAQGEVDLIRVPCACAPGTEETRLCNYGRRCGRLMVRGRDVAEIMVSEGLARSFACGRLTCPRRKSWC